eukprot:48696-Eustigmatos_ZCMA.PRE.1
MITTHDSSSRALSGSAAHLQQMNGYDPFFINMPKLVQTRPCATKDTGFDISVAGRFNTSRGG